VKIGKNEFCPCGSGKKYKKCCMLKQQNTEEEKSFEDVGNDIYDDDIYDDDIYGDDTDDNDNDAETAELFYNALTNLHSLILKRKPHIKEYNKIRKLHGEMVSSMIDYFREGKFEQRVDVNYVSQIEQRDEAKKHEISVLECDFDLATREGFEAFYDMKLYKTAPNINCITEDFISKHKYRKPEKVEFLQSMLDSKLGLYTLTKIDYQKGYAYLRDVFTNKEYKLTDIALSSNKSSAEFYVYTRIITYRNISFGTGLSFTFLKDDPFINQFIKRNKKDYYPIGEFRRFIELYSHYSRDPNKVKVLTNKI